MAFGLFKKKNKKGQGSSQKGVFLTVHEVRKETADAVSLVFEEGVKYIPGQFLTLIFTIEGKKVRRAYSLCSSPFVDDKPAVTVKRVDGGLVSNYINDHVKAGDKVEIMEAMGSFTYDVNAIRDTTVLFAGGSGVTPMMSLAKSLLAEYPAANVAFIYANRNEESIIFKDKLDDLVSKYGDRIKLTHILSEPLKDTFADYNTMPSVPFVKSLLADLNLKVDAATQYFTCGPAPMMDVVTEALQDMGVGEQNFLKESFVATTTAENEVSDGADAQVKILLDGDEFEFSVASNKGILETALDQDIDMPYSCQSGICTACRGKLINGKVTMEGCDGLSQDEIEQGYVLTCISKPASDKIEIEIG